MPVEVVHTFEEEGKPVNVATLLQCAWIFSHCLSRGLRLRGHSSVT